MFSPDNKVVDIGTCRRHLVAPQHALSNSRGMGTQFHVPLVEQFPHLGERTANELGFKDSPETERARRCDLLSSSSQERQSSMRSAPSGDRIGLRAAGWAASHF